MGEFRLDFVGIGAAKAGTTWLATCLREHPHVCLSQQKELNYFCTTHMWPQLASNRSEGKKWLRHNFSHCGVGQVKGEISPSYLVDPDAPHLLKQHSRDMGIIVSYRNPTDALYSLYYEFAKEYPVPDTFEQFLDTRTDFLQYGFYYEHTIRYLRHFSEDQVHFILFDDICDSPEYVLRDLFHFLDVDADCLPPSTSRRVNARKIARYELVKDVIGTARSLVNSNLYLRRVVRSFGLHKLGDWVQAKNLQSTRTPPMKDETRAWLVDMYRRDNERLAELLGRDLSHWNK